MKIFSPYKIKDKLVFFLTLIETNSKNFLTYLTISINWFFVFSKFLSLKFKDIDIKYIIIILNKYLKIS